MIVMSESVQATSIFARQYDMKCSACHVGGVPPMMNSTGMAFLRNGFRFSKSDETTLRATLDGKVVPAGIMLGVGYKNGENEFQAKNPQTGQPVFHPVTGAPVMKTMENEVKNPTTNLFLAGSLNENFAAFIGAKFAYMEDENGDRSVELQGSKVYLQMNQQEAKHVLRAGVISPYTQFANVTKASENAGIDDVPMFFNSPLSIANKKSIYGMDYTYEMDNGIMLLVAGGEIEYGNQETNIVLGVNYFNGENFRISAILNEIIATDSAQEIARYLPFEATLGERTTFMIAVEYKTEYAYFNTAAVYATYGKNKAGQDTDDYYGSESAITVPVFESGKIRAVGTFDNNSASAYALSYSQIFSESIMIGANLAHTSTDMATFDAVSATIYYVY